MRFSLFILVLLSVLLSSGSQIILKFGVSSPEVQSALAGSSAMRTVITIATSRLVLTGLFCFGLSAIVWLFVLSRIALSSAYPFVALGIAITSLAGFLLFKEPMPLMKLAGIACVVCGVIAVAVAT